MLQMRTPLILGWDGTFRRKDDVVNEILFLNARINRSQFVMLVGSRSCLGAPVFPVGLPSHESILLIMDAFVDLPIERFKPFQLHGVQLVHWNVANLRP